MSKGTIEAKVLRKFKSKQTQHHNIPGLDFSMFSENTTLHEEEYKYL